MIWAGGASAQTDTTATAPAVVAPGLADSTQAEPVVAESLSPAPTPTYPAPSSVLRRSLLVPGWGQLTNRDYLKVPVVAAGVGGAVWLAVLYANRTVLYRRAAIFADCDTGVAVPEGTCDNFEDFRDEWIEAGQPAANVSRSIRDDSRRNRDFSILLGTLAYALQALDAYVSAELAGFDVSDDLSLRVLPTPTGAVASLRWQF
ncbi:MAG: DUF5683 domain-containing protein [Bacteroidota bacterium]